MVYAWSVEGDLNTLQNDFAGTANDVSYTNTFTPAHQWNDATTSNGIFKYVPPTTGTTAYGTVNTVNQYGTVGGSSMTYDTRGNLTTDGTTGITYAYDAENHLMAASASSSSYAYDPLGRRTKKVVSSTTTNFVHDGDTEIAEYDASGTLLRRFVPGPAIDDYIAMVTCSGTNCATQTKTFFHVDKMGSVVAMSDMSGNIAEGPYVYDPYGNCRSGSGTCSIGVPFRYTGQRLDPETGLYYYRARMYSPTLGRFLQTDPVGYEEDLDLYTYVGDDPTDETDPSGNCPNCLLGLAIGIGAEVLTQWATGELGHAIDEAGHGNWGPAINSAARIGVSGAVGVVTGGLSVLAGRSASIGAKIALGYAGTAAQAVGGAANAAIGGKIAADIGKAAAFSAIGGRIGSAFGQAASRAFGAVAPTAGATAGAVVSQTTSKAVSTSIKSLGRGHHGHAEHKPSPQSKCSGKCSAGV